MMVAAHAWDIIGAQSAGMRGALITRPGNGPLTAPGVPVPTLTAKDIQVLAARMETYAWTKAAP
jgi:2-haloacid dehalogenase